MTQVITPQQTTINQYTASGLTDTFTYSFLVLQANSANSDMTVYLTPSGQDANPTADIVAYTDYTVTGVGNTTGGTVVFDTMPAAGDIVTIIRNMNISITTQFNDAQTFNGQSLDDAFQRVVLIMQQLATDLNTKALQYFINVLLPSVTSNQMPVLTEVDNQVWVSQGGQIVAAVIENDVNISLLRSELAIQTEGGAGTTLIGHYDEYDAQPWVLYDYLNYLPTLIVNLASAFATSGFQTGDMKPTFSPNQMANWIIWDDGTIGNASSNATNLADASTEDLFTLLWDYDESICPMFDSGGVPVSPRGASAAADYAANYAIQLPDGNGRVVANVAGGTYTAGLGFGADSVTLVAGQMPVHDHNLVPDSSTVELRKTGKNIGSLPSGNTNLLIESGGSAYSPTLAIANAGGTTPVDIKQTSMPVYWNIKL